jgi:hypothetical protein
MIPGTPGTQELSASPVHHVTGAGE